MTYTVTTANKKAATTVNAPSKAAAAAFALAGEGKITSLVPLEWDQYEVTFEGGLAVILTVKEVKAVRRMKDLLID